MIIKLCPLWKVKQTCFELLNYKKYIKIMATGPKYSYFDCILICGVHCTIYFIH